MSRLIRILSFMCAAAMLQSCYQSKLPAACRLRPEAVNEVDQLYFLDTSSYLAYNSSQGVIALMESGKVIDQKALHEDLDFYHIVIGDKGHFYVIGMERCQRYRVRGGKIEGPLESYRVENSPGNDYLSVYKDTGRVYEFESGEGYSFNRPVLPFIYEGVLLGLFNRGEPGMYEFYAVDVETGQHWFFPKDVGYRDHQQRLDVRKPGRYFAHHGKLYINYPSLNCCYIYDTQKHKLGQIVFPRRTPDYSWYYYYDPSTGREYLIKNLPYMGKEVFAYRNGEKGKQARASFTAENFEIVGENVYIKRWGSHYMVPFDKIGKE